MRDFVERGALGSFALGRTAPRLFIAEHGPRFRAWPLLSTRFSRQFRLIPGTTRTTRKRCAASVNGSTWQPGSPGLASPPTLRLYAPGTRRYSPDSGPGHTSPNRDPREAQDDVVSPIKARSTVQFVSRTASCTLDRKI